MLSPAKRVTAGALSAVVAISTIAACDPPYITDSVTLARSADGELILLGETCESDLASLRVGTGGDTRGEPEWIFIPESGVLEGEFQLPLDSLTGFEVRGGDFEVDEIASPFFVEFWTSGGHAGSRVFDEIPEPGYVLGRQFSTPGEPAQWPLDEFQYQGLCD